MNKHKLPIVLTSYLSDILSFFLERATRVKEPGLCLVALVRLKDRLTDVWWTDRQTNSQTDGPTDGQTDRYWRMDGHFIGHGPIWGVLPMKHTQLIFLNSYQEKQALENEIANHHDYDEKEHFTGRHVSPLKIFWSHSPYPSFGAGFLKLLFSCHMKH